MNWDNVRTLLTGSRYVQELYYTKEKKTIVKFGEATETGFSINSQHGYSVRVLQNRKMGLAYSEHCDLQNLHWTAEKARASARVTIPDAFHAVYPAAEQAECDGDYNAELAALTIGDKKKFLHRQLHARLQGEVRVHDFLYKEITETVIVANSFGLFKRCVMNSFFLLLQLRAREGGTDLFGEYLCLANDLQEVDFDALYAGALADARRKRRWLKGKDGRYSVIFSGSVMSKILESFFNYHSPFSGLETSLPRQSFLPYRRLKIGNALFNLEEKNSKKKFTRPFDAEGVTTRDLEICREGKISGLLHNLYSAGKSGSPPTGHGFRRDYKSPVSVRPTGLFLTGGEGTEEELIARLHTGLYIAEIDDPGNNMNFVTGEISVQGEGQLVQSGGLVPLSSRFIISFNLFKLLHGIKAKADNARDTGMNLVVAPAVLFENLEVYFR